MTAGALARTPTSAWLLTSACLALAIVVELGLIQPLRLPGHRALPTVAALLSFGRLLPPPVVLGYALLAPTLISMAQPQQRATLATYLLWTIGAAAAVALRSVERRRALAALTFGAGFGLLRALLFASGVGHGGPSRILGNVAFGVLGASLALLIIRPVERT